MMNETPDLAEQRTEQAGPSESQPAGPGWGDLVFRLVIAVAVGIALVRLFDLHAGGVMGATVGPVLFAMARRVRRGRTA